MPDDDNKEVTEQEDQEKTEDQDIDTGEERAGEAEDKLKEDEGDDEFGDAFSIATSSDSKAKKQDSDDGDKGESEEETQEDEDAEDDELKEDEVAGDKEEKDVISPEDQEFEDRAKKALQEEEDYFKEQEDKKLRDEEAKRKADAAEASRARPIDANRITSLFDLVQDSELPETMTVNGQEIKLKEHMSDFPESKVISGLITQKILERLVEHGYLMTARRHADEIEKLREEVSVELFDLRVMQLVPDALEIATSSDYKEWLKTIDEKTKALERSPKPSDFALVLKKYKQTKEAADKAAKEKEEADKRKQLARDKKKKHLDIHTSSLRPKAKSVRPEATQTDKDDFSAGFSQATESKK